MSDIKRLAACFDGTWNTERSNTNVSRLFRQIVDDRTEGAQQRRFYDEGVGTHWGDRVLGGAFGAGLDRNIRQGHAWLASQFPLGNVGLPDAEGFVQGPDIYLFGFSRGAFTARSLGGLINYLGLPRLGSLGIAASMGTAAEDPAALRAWELYASRPSAAERDRAKTRSGGDSLSARIDEHDAKVKAFREANAYYPARIHFLGVWDTVGALGIPRVFDNWTFMRPSTKYRFHDTRLGRCVRYAYHAVAIDEHREPYCVTLWTGREKTTADVEQRWFPGAHANVGGGYEDDLLPDPPLAWIAAKAAEKGLHFCNDRGLVDTTTNTVPPSIARAPAAFDLDGREYLSPVHDSYAEFMGGVYRVLRALPGAGGRVYRRMLVEPDGIDQTIDPVADRKLSADPGYRPPNLAQAGRLDVSYSVARLDQGEDDGDTVNPAGT